MAKDTKITGIPQNTEKGVTPLTVVPTGSSGVGAGRTPIPARPTNKKKD